MLRALVHQACQMVAMQRQLVFGTFALTNVAHGNDRGGAAGALEGGGGKFHGNALAVAVLEQCLRVRMGTQLVVAAAVTGELELTLGRVEQVREGGHGQQLRLAVATETAEGAVGEAHAVLLDDKQSLAHLIERCEHGEARCLLVVGGLMGARHAHGNSLFLVLIPPEAYHVRLHGPPRLTRPSPQFGLAGPVCAPGAVRLAPTGAAMSW
jgi:hypothetical protein